MDFNERGVRRMEMDYRKLQGRIKEVFGTQEAFAGALGISGVSVTKKLKCQTPWKQSEIDKACDLLGIIPNDMYLYFFTKRVKKS